MELAITTTNGRALTEKQKAWLESYLEHGNASEAARAIGVGDNCARQYGHQMKRALSGCIQANMHKLIGRCAPDALETIYDIATNCPDPKVRLAAAQDVLNRAGYMGTKKVEVSVEAKSDDEIDNEIQRLLKKGSIIDAEVV